MSSIQMATSTDTILSIKADVYETSPPGSQTTWFPKASSVLVSICFDVTRNICRIVSIVGQTPIINSCITSTSQFIESSALFGTWYDERNDTTFGVGFSNGSDLKAFANAFVQAKKKMEELASASATSNSESCTEINSSTVEPSVLSIGLDNNNHQSASMSNITSKIDSNVHSFLTLDWHNAITGTSPNPNVSLVGEKEDGLLNNNVEVICSKKCSSCNNNVDVVCSKKCTSCCEQFSLLPDLPNPNFTIKNGNADEYVVMNISPPNNHNHEMSTLAQENAYLRKALTDASKNTTDFHLELDSHRKLNEALIKAKEDALRLMEEWKSKSFENQLEANMWKERCEKAENMAQNLAEETIAKYKQQLKDAINGKDYYKSLVHEKEMELRSLKEQLENGVSNSHSHTLLAYKKENESLKAAAARAKQQENISTHLANEQWTTMRDTESKLAEGIKKIIDIHTDLKRSVKMVANWREQPQ